jgi:L-alanine-DL-glutamate epimerase-like enolase superfamily enzyme
MTSRDATLAYAGPSSAHQEHAFRREPKITAVETLIPHDIMAGLVLLRLHTDAGTVGGTPVIGHGESYYLPHAVAATLHDWMARRLLGADARAIESHWRFFYDRCASFGGVGAELRALSAIDLALWDIAGQLQGEPVWRLLGGPVRDRIPVYNSCGGPSYGRRPKTAADSQGWPGHGDPGQPGPLEDNWKSQHAAADLAEELLAEGYSAMKVWSLDGVYQQSGGLYVRQADLKQAFRQLHEIRQRVGDRIELMFDGHGFFSLPAATRICEALRDVRPLWLEDVLRPDCLESLEILRERGGVPLAISEMLVTRESYRRLLNRHAADYVMADPTWVGGISETKRIAELAQIDNVPTLMHDCTGPLTLFAGLQVAAAVPNVMWQETVRAHIRTLYPQLIDTNVTIVDGQASLPEGPGLGTRLLSELFDPAHPGYRITRLG